VKKGIKWSQCYLYKPRKWGN